MGALSRSLGLVDSEREREREREMHFFSVVNTRETHFPPLLLLYVNQITEPGRCRCHMSKKVQKRHLFYKKD
jgi:hypothetical protein